MPHAASQFVGRQEAEARAEGGSSANDEQKFGEGEIDSFHACLQCLSCNLLADREPDPMRHRCEI